MKDYSNRESQIWKIFQKHQTIPEDLQDLHFHFDDFKNTLEKDFKFLKEATLRNIQNFQTSLNLQQMYSASLCTRVNNIYSKLSELQRQIQNQHTHMNPGDTVQIEAPDFDPDIDDVSSPSTDKKLNELLTQGTSSPASEVTEPDDNSPTPATTLQQLSSQDTDWLDTVPIQIPNQAQDISESFEISDLEENSEEEQYADLESYLAHHNTYEASQYIRQEYLSRLYALDNNQYYAEVIEPIICMRHQLLKITSQQINQLNHTEPPKS